MNDFLSSKIFKVQLEYFCHFGANSLLPADDDAPILLEFYHGVLF